MRPFFTLIIPCYKPDKTIRRLFDSLTRQGISNDDLEIVVVDDNSDSLAYRDVVRSYGFNTIFAETDVEVHCPSNTRREGMNYVSGEWLCFCDQDDYFEDNALSKVMSYIKAHDKTIYVVSTIMRSYNEQTDKCEEEFAHKQAWLHGKWYSVDNLIKPFNINFKKDLVTHEDIYFNSLVLAKLFSLNTDWDYLDTYTYRWVDNPESITRKPTNDRGYLYENFNDYIVSAGEPYWNDAKETKNPVSVNQVIMTLLHSYFYYEAAIYYGGTKKYKDILQIIQKYLLDIVNEIGLSLDYIVSFVYSDPKKYNVVLHDCDMYTGKFVPTTSFKDFVYALGGKYKDIVTAKQ